MCVRATWKKTIGIRPPFFRQQRTQLAPQVDSLTLSEKRRGIHGWKKTRGVGILGKNSPCLMVTRLP